MKNKNGKEEEKLFPKRATNVFTNLIIKKPMVVTAAI